jgi:hypothetical protein
VVTTTSNVLSPEQIEALLNPPLPAKAPQGRQPTGRVADVVVRYFDIKVAFNCTVKENDVRCNKQTQYLFLGAPCCKYHLGFKLQELLDSPTSVEGMLYGNGNQELD